MSLSAVFVIQPYPQPSNLTALIRRPIQRPDCWFTQRWRVPAAVTAAPLHPSSTCLGSAPFLCTLEGIYFSLNNHWGGYFQWYLHVIYHSATYFILLPCVAHSREPFLRGEPHLLCDTVATDRITLKMNSKQQQVNDSNASPEQISHVRHLSYFKCCSWTDLFNCSTLVFQLSSSSSFPLLQYSDNQKVTAHLSAVFSHSLSSGCLLIYALITKSYFWLGTYYMAFIIDLITAFI